MTIEQAKMEIHNIDTFCNIMCNNCTGNDWYCPLECELIQKARRIGYDRIINRYIYYDGDLKNIARYIKNAIEYKYTRGKKK